MVNISDFKEDKTLYLSVMEVVNSSNREAVITGEATVQEFNSKGGKAFKKLIIPVEFNAKPFLLGVYADVGQRLGLMLGFETKQWVGKKIVVSIAGSKSPYLTIETPEGGKTQ